MDRRRLLLIILFFAAAAGIALALYFVFFRKPPAAPPVAPTPTAPGVAPGLPIAAPGAPPPVAPGAPPALPQPSLVARGGLTKVTTLVNVPVQNPTLAGDGRTLAAYNAQDGLFYRIAADGAAVPLTQKPFFNVEEITWSRDASRAVLEFPDGSNIAYDFSSHTQATLPKHWEDFDFAAAGGTIAAKSVGTYPENRFLVVANADGSGARAVAALGENADRVDVAWSPQGQVVAFSRTGDPVVGGAGRQEVLLIGMHGENFKSLIVDGLAFEPQWAPDGARVLYSVATGATDLRPELFIVNAQGEAIGTGKVRLGLATWAHKCAFSGSSALYCAVPTTLPEAAGVEPEIAEGIPDVLFKVDLATGAKAVIAVPDGAYSMENLQVTADGSVLYFRDANTGMLQKIQLK